MGYSSQTNSDETPPAPLAPVLDVVALWLEDPVGVATRIALTLSITGVTISVVATLLDRPAGAGLAAFYAASALALSLHLEKRLDEAHHGS